MTKIKKMINLNLYNNIIRRGRVLYIQGKKICQNTNHKMGKRQQNSYNYYIG